MVTERQHNLNFKQGNQLPNVIQEYVGLESRCPESHASVLYTRSSVMHLLTVSSLLGLSCNDGDAA